ncbi:MAG: hypothetical protein M3Z36_06150 [Acidobacteriota bacterium]|nr:hypothetical protein [Acidobacteriota bacterium]
MNCEDFEPILFEAARGATNSEALAHVAACRRCALRLANERALNEELAGIAARSLEAPLYLEGKLLAEFRKASKRRTVFTRGRIAMAAGIAAALILAITWRVPAPEAPQVVRFENPLPVRTVGSSATPSLAPRRSARRHAVRAKTRKAAPRTELADDFLPIPYAEPLTPVERAEVVRVNVGQPGDTSFPADVVVGQDGLVRAIRFLRTSQ